MVLMFIGGTPGSTAGGIKTTTLGILWMQSWAALRGQEDVEFGHRRFSQENIYRASMLVFISAMIVIIAVMLLSISEPIPKGQGLEYILFEVLSAFSTTGLSMGLTPHLTLFGKSIIMVLMFIGRVGLFTVMYTILNANRRQRHYRYVEEGVMIG
jgi:trk system potassium uptake protein TrkH